MQTLSVTELSNQIKSLLDTYFTQVRVSGEVSNFTEHTSGHLYFTLKDEKSSLKCVMFRGNAQKLKFKIEDGLKLTLEGSITIYAPRGDYQLNCAMAYADGVGGLSLAYQQLKEEYEKKGYFKNKKPLPKFPKKVALLTSITGAVLQDMQSIAKKRWNLVRFVVLDTLVQGEGAKESIVKNLKIADTLSVDCIILARGGGSLEDLWAFNEPVVIEEIYATKTPIISAIGHEPDYVLSDFVADLRAPTPSGAIELLLPQQEDWLRHLDILQESFDKSFTRILQAKTTQIQRKKEEFNKNNLFNKIKQFQIYCQQQMKFLNQKIEHKLNLLHLQMQNPSLQIHLKMKQKLEKFNVKMESLKIQMESKNPKNFQKKGYACVLSNGKTIKNLAELKLDSIIELQDGSATLKAQIKEVLK
ncbi:exodeoxyribonuclease VII large subunit [uncultured Helicobacter sp.]|uniref:exodeoxyribonuclease VII large subunit n=1 Tax=uncultured Helicobacter sp. TaxID=175537 RepID=UPI00262B0D41|nr:exodeoxyribonuclease VII large subunit [uncultured Helicobacter sp.]